ncbi:helicase POLQ-like [Galendromus occidentalis]|uniref:Helicase POLQ-like n=1 Tax=Galendromus occidentalis TaxID=34638 RepID=A0AAJ7WGW7_9ACAR|nr:helicase POLQ-like [Galendromus occidentalis]
MYKRKRRKTTQIKMADDSMDLFDTTLNDNPQRTPLRSLSKNVTLALNTQDTVLSMSILDQVKERLRYNQKVHEATQIFVEESQNASLLGGAACDGDFFGLPSNVKDILFKERGIGSLYDWQKECLSLPAVERRQNLIYSLPTSGGKTLVAEILAFKELIVHRRNVLFILPYVSIVQEKVRALANLGIELGFLVEEYAGSIGKIPPVKRKKRPSIYVATIEKAHFLINALVRTQRLEELGLVIIDELHMIGDGSQRGAGLEVLLVKLKKMSNAQLIGMSATIGNINEVAGFLNAEIYLGSFRPVELIEHILVERTVLEVTKSFELRLKRKLTRPTSEEQEKCDPDHVTILVEELIPTSSVLVFCPTRKNCESVALNLSRFLKPELRDFRVENKIGLLKALSAEAGRICPVLRKTIPFGVAYHHSGLTNDERKLVEEAYIVGTLSCLCCTSTLAAGVNLPAKRVILKSPYVGVEFLTSARYKQMIGRAGRAGLDSSGESILICKASTRSSVMKLLRSPIEHCRSSVTLETLEALAISVVGMGVVTSTAGLEDIYRESLFCQQNSERDASELVHEVIQSLEAEKLIFVDEKGKLTASPLGRASFKGVVEPHRVTSLHRDLRMAMAHLSLTTHLHLIYLISPSDMEPSRLDGMLYMDLYNELTEEDRQVAETIGITENLVVRLRLNKPIKDHERKLLSKFYVTLQLNALWKKQNVWQVADRFEEHRGSVQNLLSMATVNAMSISQFCSDLPEFWALRDLLPSFVNELSHCSSMELMKLMELPAVKRGRARQLYTAGYRKVSDIAKADPKELVEKLDHMPCNVAAQIVAAAKHYLLKKAEDLQEEADQVLQSFITV